MVNIKVHLGGKPENYNKTSINEAKLHSLYGQQTLQGPLPADQALSKVERF